MSEEPPRPNLTIARLPDRRSEQDAELVQMLEELLEDAKAGKIHAMAAVFLDSKTHHSQTLRHRAMDVALLGALHVFLARLTDLFMGRANKE